ncbi:hypothetical protein LDENG_00053650 [Lucifuga dentata]|nr:hypothetical protein LDENG_00053650 [Lucifuga dentata]
MEPGPRKSLGAVMGPHTNCLLFIQDALSGRLFLCDTGAQVSILPVTAVDMQVGQRGTALEAAKGSRIPTFGKWRIPLCFNRWHFFWDFVVDKMERPLLGADFLCSYSLLVEELSACGCNQFCLSALQT